MATKARHRDAQKDPNIPSKYRKLIQKKKGIKASLTPSGNLLMACVANKFSGGNPFEFDFSVPRPVFLKKKESFKSYPFSTMSTLEKLELVRSANSEFLSHWRLIGPVPIHDALVHRVILANLRQRIDPLFSNSSHAFRRDTARFSVFAAVSRYEQLASDYSHMVKLDIVRFFDEIDHDILNRLCRNMFVEAQFAPDETTKFMNILQKFMVCSPRMIIGGTDMPMGHSKGIIQGGALSTLLSNIYLHPFDKHLEENGWPFIRYADDIVIFCQSADQAQYRKTAAERFLLDHLMLRCGNKVLVGEPWAGVDYLGCLYADGRKSIRQKTISKFRKKIDRLTRLGQTRKSDGLPYKLSYVIQRVNNQLGFVKLAEAKPRKQRKHGFCVMYCWARFIASHHREFDGLEQQFLAIDRYIRHRLRRYLYECARMKMPWDAEMVRRTNRLFKKLGLRTAMEAYRRARAIVRPQRLTAPQTPRFPWGYAIATLLPLGFIATMYGLTAVLETQQSLGPAMLLSLLVGPSGAVVALWGAIRLWRGDGRRFPALRWLITVPILFCAAGFLLG